MLAAALFVVLFTAGCNGAGGGAEVVEVVVDTADHGGPLPTAQSRLFTAEVSGSEDASVTWDADGGELETEGGEAVFTAPSTAGTFVITATSVADPTASDSAEVHVEAAVDVWNDQFGTASYEYPDAVATDAEGNVYVAGSTRGDLFATRTGAGDIFIVKYDPDGKEIWTRQFGGTRYNNVRDLAVDDAGNLYATGSAEDLFATPQGDDDVIVMAYGPTGTELWSAQFGTPERDAGNGIALDDDGNVYVTGYTQGDLFATSEDRHDVFVAKFDSTGSQVWGEQRGTSEVDAGARVVVDGSGVYAAGATLGSLFASNQGSGDIFVIKFDFDGNEQWSEQFGTSGADDAFAAAEADGGGVHVAGATAGDFFGRHEGGGDIFLATIGTDGALEGGEQWGTEAPDEAMGMTTDPEGNILLAGVTHGDLYGEHEGDKDVFVAKLDPSGVEVWGRQFGTVAEEEATAVTVDGKGNVIATGTATGDLFGDHEGETDGFAVKLTP